MKIAYVTPRYGTEVVGGAEYAARMLAERLVAQLGWTVEVFTSAALDAATWANHYAPGTTQVNGVEVHRFATTEPRHPDFLTTSAKVHARPALAPYKEQQRWINQQGPLVPELLGALPKTTADLVVFYPYLYYPTVRGLPLVAERSVMHPAAHDEAALRMPVFGPVFGATQAFVFQTDGERRLAEQRFPIAEKPQLLLGLGVDPLPQNPTAQAEFRRRHNLGDRPYLVCLGRVDNGKGSGMLARYFTEYKRRYPGPLALVYAGPVVDMPITGDALHNDIVVTGRVSDEDKWCALRGALALVSPSPYEAFSLALVEGWAAGTPALVNAACLATREHAQRSQGALQFGGYLEFEAAVEVLQHRPDVAVALAQAGERYVNRHFRWPMLIERYGVFLEQVAARVHHAQRRRFTAA